MAAYWFFRHDGRFAKALLGLILVGWLIPFAVYLVPFYIEVARLNLTDNLIFLGVAYGAIHTPFGTYFMLAYYRQALVPEVLEAAAVDGASILRQFLRIVLPLAARPSGRWRRWRSSGCGARSSSPSCSWPTRSSSPSSSRPTRWSARRCSPAAARTLCRSWPRRP